MAIGLLLPVGNLLVRDLCSLACAGGSAVGPEVCDVTADPAKSWELDAMDPNDLRERVRDEIQSYMDMDTWRRALEVESVEKKSMQDFHAEWLRRLGR